VWVGGRGGVGGGGGGGGGGGSIFILTLQISFLFFRRNFAYHAHDVPVVRKSVIEVFV
jgi:hypothetical protein